MLVHGVACLGNCPGADPRKIIGSIYMGTGYVTQVLEIVLAADNEIERAVALKQTESNNYIAGRLEDCQIGASITTEIPVVGNVVYRTLN